MTALLALALAAAPGCPEALAAADALEPAALAAQAASIVAGLERGGAGGPAEAIRAEAGALAEEARAGRGDLEVPAARFRARLARHCALTLEPPAAAALRPGDRRALAEILARPEFRQARDGRGALSRWLAELWRRILDLLGTEEAGRYAVGGRTAFFAAVALAAAAALAWALRRRAGRERAARPSPASPPPSGPGAPPEPAALAGGLPAEMVRQTFLAFLAALERHGLVPRGRALTNREMAGHLAAAGPRLPPNLVAGFAHMALLFDRTVYGGAAPTADEAGALAIRARHLRSMLGGMP